MSWAGLTAKLNTEKDARDKADAALAKAEAECVQVHGCGLYQHVTNAMKAAVVTPQEVANRRSADGKQWMNTPAEPAHPQPSINAYHKLEEDAKAAVQAGNIPLAIQRLEDANKTQQEYEIAKFGSANSGHAASSTFRLARRNSLNLIHRQIIEADKGVCQAKVDAVQILTKHGAKLPGLN